MSCADRTLTYSQLDDRSDALVHVLTGLGVTHGDRIGVFMRNRPELIEAMMACFKGGFVFVPLNVKLVADEVAYHLTDSGAAAVITDVDVVSVVIESGVVGSGVLTLVAGGGPPTPTGTQDYESAVAAGLGQKPPVVPVDRDDTAWLFYTSGTTGRPKGAMLSHGALGFVTASWLADLTPMSVGDVVLHAAPLTHGAGFHAIAAIARGAHQIIPADTRFDPESILRLLVDKKVTNTWLVPTQIVMLVDAAHRRREQGRAPHLPHLRHIVYGGAPFASADLAEALEVFGSVFVQLYAQGESPMTVTVLPPEDHVSALAGDRPERLTSAGFARPGIDIRIVDGDDHEVPTGTVGEITVSGPPLMTGYRNRPDATTEALRGGRLHTGDLGRLDSHGYLYVLDRAKDLIITGGSNVYAIEVESVLAAHGLVREVAVVGLPDRTWGELVAAVVVTDGAVDDVSDALSQHCSEQLAGYKIPRRYMFVDSLPRNAYGKVLKKDLRSLLAVQNP